MLRALRGYEVSSAEWSVSVSQQSIVLYLHVHQPWRVRKYSIFDTATHHNYFDESDQTTERNNATVFRKVADKSYCPMNALLEKLLDEHPEFKFSLSITGTFLEQAEMWAPDVIDSFKTIG
uniref:Glyco_hydro_57 n=1 Tax=uncultured Porphyromonas sp. TaxID=159274 RepID=A0A060C865_9PORP|nr:Glyco_hydro_57 [uncultured Porphyromonas sp.]